MNLKWRKSSYSATADCVQMAVRYVKSSRSSGGAECADAVYVRDSKAGSDGAMLTFAPTDWRVFLKGVRADG